MRNRYEKWKQPVIQSPPRGHQACLLGGFPIALNHCHLCLQLQEQMPRKNPSAKAEARESRYQNLEHCRNRYQRGEKSVCSSCSAHKMIQNVHKKPGSESEKLGSNADSLKAGQAKVLSAAKLSESAIALPSNKIRCSHT